MNSLNNVINISQIMQAAVTPVFLLAGIGALLNVMSARLGRVKDRMRNIQSASFRCKEDREKMVLNKARLKLIFRSRCCYGAICFAVGSGLFVCFTIITLFIEGLYKVDASFFIAFLFMACMIFLIISLIFMVIEVFIATRSIHKKIEDTEIVMSQRIK